MIDGDYEGRIFCYQCPLCKDWQMDYTERVFTGFAVFRDYGSGLQIDLTPAHKVIEDVLRGHLAESHPHSLRLYEKTGRLV